MPHISLIAGLRRRLPHWFSCLALLAATGAGFFWLPARASHSLFDFTLSAAGAPAGPFTIEATPEGATGQSQLAAAAGFQIRASAGSGDFGSAATFPAANDPVTIVVSDINNDGRPDLITANILGDTVSVFIGAGNGTFGAKTDFPTGKAPFGLAVADVNGDELGDLLVSNYHADSVSVLLNLGGGAFGPKTDYPAGSLVGYFSVADMNGDGKLDLVVANLGTGAVSVLRGNGNGTFQAATILVVGGASNWVEIVDVNSDGTPDLLVANYSANALTVLLGTGGGNFGPKTDYPVGTNPVNAAVGDLNNDDMPDVAVANADGTASILLNTGNGHFGLKTDYPVGDSANVYPSAVALADLNGDSFLDMAVINLFGSPGHKVSLYFGVGNGTFSGKTDYPAGTEPSDVKLADVNGDGVADMVIAMYKDQSVAVRLGRGGAMTPPGTTTVPYGGIQTYTMTPQPGYMMGDVRVDGVSQGVLTSYSFIGVSTAHLFSAAFRPMPAHVVLEQPAGTGIPAGGTQNFGAAVTGSGSASLTFTIRNTGGADLTGLGLTIDGADASMFSVTALPTAPVTGPTGSTTFTVRFAPTASGTRAAVLHIASNDPAQNPFNIAVSGIGTIPGAPYLLVEQPAGTGVAQGASRNLGTAAIGSGVSATFTLRNVGTANLTGFTVTVDGADAALFSVTASPVSPVVPGANTTLTVRFAPVAVGTRTAALHIASNDPTQNPFNIGLSGTGAATAASFVGSDVANHGTWRGVYGAQGYMLAGDATSLPGSVQVTMTGQSQWTYSGSTADTRALQRPTGSSRLAAVWYDWTTFSYDVRLTDGLQHQVALYSVDWDGLGQSQRFDLLDGDTGALLSTRTLSGFSGGQYLVWNLLGHITIRVTNTGPANAVVSGLFLDSAPGASSNAAPTVSLTSPANGASFASGAAVTVSANASDSDGTVTSVQFFAGVTPIGTDTTSPYSISWTPPAAGNYSLTAVATDNQGATTTSAAVAITVTAGNSAPSVSLTAPANGASFASGAAITVSANASDSDGTVSSVQFFAGATPIGTDTTSPFSISWTPAAVGGYSLTAVATDNQGATKTSAAVAITVTGPNSAPSVSLTAPANGASFAPGAAITVSANASDSDGTVSSVQFFAGATPIGTDTTSPYSISWTPAAGGSYSLTAVATDNQGATTSSAAVTISVTAPGGNAATFVRSDTTTKGTWQGAFGAQGYSLANDGTSFPGYAQVTMTGQGSWTWAGSTTDTRALQRATVTGRMAATYYFSTFTTDVRLTDGLSHQIALYLLDWDSLGRTEQIEVLNADTNAVLDTRNASAFSGGQYLVWTVSGHVAFRVTNTGPANGVVSGLFFDAAGGAANAAPTVSITAPAGGASFASGAAITVSANASDSDGTVSSVQFFAGVTPIGTDSTSPFSISWTPAAAGNYSLTAVATDNQGAATTSAAVPITVTAANSAPTVSLTAPANGASFASGAAITVSANASDSDGTVSSVQFFAGVTPIGTDSTSPFSISWTPAAAGNYSLTAVATDNQGATTTAAAVAITVTAANSAPTVSLTAPANGASFASGAAITVSANASDSDGTVSSVQFFAGVTPIGTDSTSPFSISWTPAAAGNYSLTAVATDNQGATTTSAAVAITVTAAGVNAASFVRSDVATKGSWHGAYGAQGYSIANDATSLPGYAQVGMSGQGAWTWASSTTDTRALQRATLSGRMAATWYGFSTFTIDIQLTGGAPHQVALYHVDWDNIGRTQRIDVLDANTLAVLDTRTLTGFSGGQYLVWNLSGHVVLRVTNTGPGNAVVSGLFVD